ncbi:hypothetical protein Tco_0543595 [Tanacetum coccineum]
MEMLRIAKVSFLGLCGGIRDSNVEELVDKVEKKGEQSDHRSRIENEETSDDSEVNDNFPGETLIEINTEDEPWFAEFANYLANDIIPKGMTYQQKKKIS